MKSRRALVVLLILATVATAIKAGINMIFRDYRGPRPCWSRGESKQKGVWGCDVSIEPSEVSLGGRTYRIGESWVEEAGDDEHFLVWFPYRSRLGWNRVCLRIPRYEDGAIVLDLWDRDGAITYKGEDYLIVVGLKAGESGAFECKAEFWQWEPETKRDRGKVNLGKVTLKPLLEGK